ncbi:MAG: hypothetical protein F8N39_01580, partial [Clostridiaceae bacterium]|nr:hypothetical protein [Clostridiaceae bacterium]
MFKEIPIIYAPIQQFNSLSGLSIFYHEFGHNVIAKFPEITTNLLRIVYTHYDELKQNVGIMNPQQRDQRNEQIGNAIRYWDNTKLNELFCDIFATYICGPPYYYSNVDFAIKIDSDIFNVEKPSTHPCWAVRVRSSYNTLLDVHKTDEVVEVTKRSWEEHKKNFSKGPFFELFCSELLVNKLIHQSILDIDRLLNVEQCC